MKKRVVVGFLAFCVVLTTLTPAGALYIPPEDSQADRDVEYLYDSADPTGDVVLRTDLLGSVVNTQTALNAVRQQIQFMTADQKESPADIDLCTLYAETAVSSAARKQVTGREIVINRSTVSDVESVALQTRAELESTLEQGGITTARDLSDTVTFLTDATGKITIRVEPDILTTKVDRVRVETPTFALTLKISEMEEDLSRTLLIYAEDVGTEYETGTSIRIPKVKIEMPDLPSDSQLNSPVTLSLPTGSAEPTYMAVLNASGDAEYSKYNPATTSLDGKITSPGLYGAVNNTKNFTDIGDKDSRMQRAIRELAARGIINGKTEDTFAPDETLLRSHFVALVMRGLAKIDNSAVTSFNDVPLGAWFYSAAASSQKHGIIAGFPDGSFRGDDILNKGQIYTVAGRILKEEMGYREPDDPVEYLSQYKDGGAISEALRSMVALATKEDLVVLRKDGRFAGGSAMTRGDAALILYNLFQKIW